MTRFLVELRRDGQAVFLVDVEELLHAFAVLAHRVVRAGDQANGQGLRNLAYLRRAPEVGLAVQEIEPRLRRQRKAAERVVDVLAHLRGVARQPIEVRLSRLEAAIERPR